MRSHGNCHREGKMYSVVKSIIIGFLFFGLIGCGGGGKGYYKFHAGRELNPSQIAIVKGQYLYTIDGKKGPNPWFSKSRTYFNATTSQGSFVVELLPGKHIFTVGFIETRFLRRENHTRDLYQTQKSVHDAVLVLEAKVGKVYRIEAEVYGKKPTDTFFSGNWKPVIREIE
jgi:hypothetical protein